jgi:hypothetical protein
VLELLPGDVPVTAAEGLQLLFALFVAGIAVGLFGALVS